MSSVWMRKWNNGAGRYDAPVQMEEAGIFAAIGRGFQVCGPKGTNPEDIAALADEGSTYLGVSGVMKAGDVPEIGDLGSPDILGAAVVAPTAPAPPPAVTTTQPPAPEPWTDEADDEELVTGSDLEMPPAPGVTATPTVSARKAKKG